MHFMRNWTNRQKKKDKCSLNGNQNDPFPFMPSFYGNRKIDSLLSFACSFSTLRPLGAFHFATFAMTDLIWRPYSAISWENEYAAHSGHWDSLLGQISRIKYSLLVSIQWLARSLHRTQLIYETKNFMICLQNGCGAGRMPPRRGMWMPLLCLGCSISVASWTGGESRLRRSQTSMLGLSQTDRAPAMTNESPPISLTVEASLLSQFQLCIQHFRFLMLNRLLVMSMMWLHPFDQRLNFRIMNCAFNPFLKSKFRDRSYKPNTCSCSATIMLKGMIFNIDCIRY